MPTERKRKLKAFIARWELWFHGGTATLFGLALAGTLLLLPNVSNTVLAVLVLIGTFTSSLGSIASAIKSDDTTK